ncbi:MAG TPA: hypothetical protein VGK67_34775 [Myxococcales bacterium]|jgi:hypothetical protein
MQRLFLLLAALALAGCRDFKVPPEPEPPKEAAGARCATDADCTSGVCLTEHSNASICCEKKCADDETCWAFGHIGSCVLRLPGTQCVEEKDCPQALSCVDEVCCLSSCAPWQACNLDNHEGTCTNKNQFGEVCTKDAECPAPEGEAAGHCVKGVCCTSACKSWEVCVEAGQRCAAERALGDACAASADCPPPPGFQAGFCVDKVCCDQACDSRCSSCARQAREGICGEQDPNLDLRGECPECTACFWGRCEPAVPGSDPKDDCAGAAVCSVSGQCGLAQGAACTVGDFCSVGDCTEGACLLASSEEVFASPMSASAQRRDIYGLAQNGVDEVAAVFEESEKEDGTSNFVRHTLFAAQRAKDGRWTVSPLDSCANYESFPVFVGGAVLQGRTVFIASYHSESGLPGACEPSNATPPPEGVWARQIAPGGAMGPFETIDDTAQEVGWVLLRSDPTLGLAVAYTCNCGAARCIRVRVREPAGAGTSSSWKQVLSAPSGGALWDMSIVRGVPTVLTIASTTATIHQPGSPTVKSTHPFPVDIGSCGWPAVENLQTSMRSRVNPTTGAVEEGLLFTSEDCPLNASKVQPKIGTWWPSTDEWTTEALDPDSMFGITLGGPNAAIGMVRWNEIALLGTLHHTWLDGDGNRQSQLVFLPPGFEDLATTSGAAVFTPAGTATYLVATGERAVSPVPRALYLVTLHR